MPTYYDRKAGEFFLGSITPTREQTESHVVPLGSGFLAVWIDTRAGFNQVYGQRYDADGQRLGSDFLVSSAAFTQKNPVATELPGGGFAIGWAVSDGSGNGIRGQILDAAGNATGAAFQVNTVTTNEQDQPAIIALSGGFVVTWRDASLIGGDASSRGIKGQMFDLSGSKVGGEFLVNTLTTAEQKTPALTALAGGGFVALWQNADTNSSAYGIKAQIYDAAGAKVGGEFQVLPGAVLAATAPAAAALPGGGFAAVWSSTPLSGSAPDIYLQLFDAAGHKVGSPILANSATSGFQIQPAIAVDANGTIAVTWYTDGREGSEIHAQLFDAGGTKLGSEFLVNTVNASDQSAPQLAFLSSGALVVSWTDYGYTNGSYRVVKGQMFVPTAGDGVDDIQLSAASVHEEAVGGVAFARISSSGGAVNGAITYSLVDDYGGAFRLDGDKLVVADPTRLDYESATTASVTVRAVDATGVPVDKVVTLQILDDIDQPGSYTAGAEFMVNAPAPASPQGSPSVASLSGGGFVSVWFDNSVRGDIRGQVFNAAGAKVGGEIAVDTATAGSQDQPSVASFADGGFVVTWQDSSLTGGDASGWSIKAQRFDATGAKIGGEFLVNSLTTGDQTAPSVETLAGGGFVVGWQTIVASPYSSNEIHFQVYDASGNRLGGEHAIQRLPTTPNEQATPDIAALPGGGFVLVWQDDDRGQFVARAQVFSAEGIAQADAFTASGRNGAFIVPAVAALPSGGFVLGWSDSVYSPDGVYRSIKLRVYDAAGHPLTDEILGSTPGLSSQYGVALSALAGGGFIATWTDASGTVDGSFYGVVAQRFDDLGNKVGGLFVVPQTTDYNQQNSAVVGLDNGGILIAWDDSSGTAPDGSGVRARLITLDGLGAAHPDQFRTSEGVAIGSGLNLFADNGHGADVAGASGTLSIAAVMGSAAAVGHDIVLASGAHLTVNADGTFAYAPGASAATLTAASTGASNLTGGDTFTYTLADGTTATVSIAIDGVISPEDRYLGTPGNDTIVGGDGGHLFRVEQGGSDSATGGSGDDGFYFGGALDAGDRITGGAGSDALILQGNYGSNASAPVQLQAQQLAGIETLRLLSGTDRTYGDAAGNVYHYYLKTVDGDVQPGATLTVDARSLTDIAGVYEPLSFDGSAETDGGFLFLVGGVSNILSGGAGNDAVMVQGRYTNLSLANIESVAIVAGSRPAPGDNWGHNLHLDGQLAGGPIAIHAETLAADEGFFLDAYQFATKIEVFGSVGDDYIAPGALGGLLHLDQGGDDYVSGNTGNDAVYFGGAFTANDGVFGYSGSDTVILQGNYPNLSLGNLQSVETLKLLSASDGTYAAPQQGAYSYGIVAPDALVSTAQQLKVDGSGLGALESLSFNGSAETNGSYVLLGGAGDDVLTGGSGNDVLDGGAGGDHLAGGGGNDVYYVDDARDVVTELAGGGTDEIRTYSGFTLPANVENLTGLSTQSGHVLEGNDGANLITGAAVGDWILGLGGDDVVHAGAGDDFIFGGIGGDVLAGEDGNDAIYSDASEPNPPNISWEVLPLDARSDVDTLRGGNGDDILAAGYGDNVDGGAGTDTLTLSFLGAASGVTVDLAALAQNGTITLFGGTITGVEQLRTLAGSNFADVLDPGAIVGDTAIYGFGGDDLIKAGANTLWGLGGDGNDILDGTASVTSYPLTLMGEAGDDILIGGHGSQSLNGGTGNDIYRISDGANGVFENPFEGIDEVQTTLASYTLGANVENLTGLSNAGQTLNGNGLDNVIKGGTGADTMAGGTGNDVYYVDNAGDVVIENAGEGTDEVRTTLANYVLAANVEKLTYIGTGNWTFTGGAGNDNVGASDGNDFFDLTQGGADKASGGGGTDAFSFGATFGAGDSVDGGAGSDTVGIRGDYTGANKLTIAAGQLVNVETLSIMTSLGGPVGYDISWSDGNLAANQRMAIYAGNLQAGENVTFDGSAETRGYFVMYGGLGTDTLKGGALSDGFYFGPGKFSQADHVDGGGGGQNQLGLDGSYDFSAGSALGTFGGNFTNIQTIVLYAGDPVYNIVTNDAAVAAGKLLTIFGTPVGSNLVFDGSAETDGAFKILSGTGDDTLSGGHGNDTLYGNLGADTLTGGAGNDVFLYTDAAQSTAAKTDHILDFDAGDKVDLSQIDADSTQGGDQAFSFINSDAFGHHAGELRAEFDQANNVWTIQGDTDGDGNADFTLLMTTANNHALVNTDFVL